MELDKAKKIVETVSAKEVNKFIETGWLLVATASMTTDSSEYSSPMIKYSLGWFKDEPPVQPKWN